MAARRLRSSCGTPATASSRHHTHGHQHVHRNSTNWKAKCGISRGRQAGEVGGGGQEARGRRSAQVDCALCVCVQSRPTPARVPPPPPPRNDPTCAHKESCDSGPRKSHRHPARMQRARDAAPSKTVEGSPPPPQPWRPTPNATRVPCKSLPTKRPCKHTTSQQARQGRARPDSTKVGGTAHRQTTPNTQLCSHVTGRQPHFLGPKARGKARASRCGCRQHTLALE
jgi:hypothetical protein